MIGMLSLKRGHHPIDTHDQRIRGEARRPVAVINGGGGAVLGVPRLGFFRRARHVGRDGHDRLLFGRFGYGAHPLGYAANGVTVERDIDEGVHQRGNLIKGEIDRERRDRLSQSRGEPFGPER